MRKKVLSLCMALALCLSLLPAAALAAAPENQVIYVGSVEISSTGYWTTDSAGNVTSAVETRPSDNYIYYDGNGTLTLHNATIKKGLDYDESIQGGTYIHGSAIGVFNQNGDAELTIQLEGSNTVGASTGVHVYSSNGTATLNITGENGGSLIASGSSNSGIWVQSTSSSATLTIQNADVTLTPNYGIGVSVQAVNSSNASLSVEGGSLTASGRKGILFPEGNPSLNVSDSAIVRASGGIASDASSETGPVTTGGTGGIVFNGNAGTVYGDVELQENLEIGENESLDIPSGASLTIGNDATLTNKGEVTTTGGGTLTNNGTIDNSGTLPSNIGGTAPPSIITESLPSGTMFEDYNQALTATGSDTITWSVTGSLPVGLSLNGNTISGTPTAQGTSNFTVKATNEGGSDSEELSIEIKQAEDATPPTLTAGSATRTGEATATVTFTSSEAGSYYYAVVEHDETTPTIDTSGAGTACGTTEQTISLDNFTGAGAKDIYIVVKDAANNVSDRTFKIEIPAYVAPSYSISVDPTSLDFGSANAGYTTVPVAQTVTITNTGDQSVTVDLPTSTNYTITAGTGFTNGTATLAPNGTAQFSVQPKTGLGVGTYSEAITISGSNGASAALTASFTVSAVPVTGVTLDKVRSSLTVGDSEALIATVAPDDATDKAVTWTSSDSAVATVDQNGVVTAVGPGRATITVTTADGGKTATCTVTVSRPYLPPVTDPSYAITVPTTAHGTVTVHPTSARAGTEVTITVTPDEGHELAALSVLDSRGSELALTDKGEGQYTFTMPAGRVTVEAAFAETAPAPLPFADVPEGAWYEEAVRYVYESGLMAGTSGTTFSPDVTTSRAMIVTILWRLSGSPVVNYLMDFDDVDPAAYYGEAIRWATSEGIAGGYGGGVFGPDDPITREQLAVMLHRYAQHEGYDVSIGEDTNILSYADFADLSEYAIPAMQWACGAGIIHGTGDGSTLTPQGEATRAQAATVLMRFCEQYQ